MAVSPARSLIIKEMQGKLYLVSEPTGRVVFELSKREFAISGDYEDGVWLTATFGCVEPSASRGQ